MPQELPGFYYDEEKNRYFPIKGPMPGSSARKPKPSPDPPASKLNQLSGSFRCQSIRNNELLQVREVCGNMIASRKGKINFQMEYEKRRASQPLIWKYPGTERVDRALELAKIDIDTCEGVFTSDIMVAGGINGSLCFYETQIFAQEPGHLVYCMPERVWPLETREQVELPRDLGANLLATMNMPSDISCIKNLPNHHVSDANVLITTLEGSVHNLRFKGPVDYYDEWRQVDEVTSLNSTIWTADCNSDGSRAVIGTSRGAYMVNTETRTQECVCRCESDVLSIQVDPLGDVMLCGLRNGAILTLDTRQKPRDRHTSRLTRHKVPYPLSKPSHRQVGNRNKQWFELKGNIVPRHTIFLPSSVSCLASLKLHDQYFCASSMDGLIKLYDHRLSQRGPVQTYEGNVNSHTRIQFGIDPSERILVSGGEDCNLRIWSIKSGELLFENRFMNSTPSVVSWERIDACLTCRLVYQNRRKLGTLPAVGGLGLDLMMAFSMSTVLEGQVQLCCLIVVGDDVRKLLRYLNVRNFTAPTEITECPGLVYEEYKSKPYNFDNFSLK